MKTNDPFNRMAMRSERERFHLIPFSLLLPENKAKIKPVFRYWSDKGMTSSTP